MPQRHSGRAREDQDIGLRRHKFSEICFKVGADMSRKGHAPFPSFRLRRPIEVATARQLGKGSFYPDCARVQVDVTRRSAASSPQRRLP